MNIRLSVNLSVLGTFLVLILPFSFGFYSYTETKKTIVANLNQALQQTTLQDSHLQMSQDSIRTYANLSKLFDNPVSIENYNKDLSDALSYTSDKRKMGIVIHVLNKDPQTENAPANTSEKLDEYYITNGAIIWASSITNNPNATTDHIGISFQGCTSYSTSAVIGLSDKPLPGLFLGLVFLPTTLPLLLKRYRKELMTPQSIHPEKTTSSDNLDFSYETTSFYKENEEKLKPTPQRYALMEMLFLPPTHILSHSDICESLWPGEISANGALNTLIRRLWPLVKENNNLKITTDRGRACVLEIKKNDHL